MGPASQIPWVFFFCKNWLQGHYTIVPKNVSIVRIPAPFPCQKPMTLISKNCQKSVTKNQLGHYKLLADTPNIVCSVQSALSPHKHWAERHFASKFGTRHLGGGRSTGLAACPPHPGRPLRGLPTGQAGGDRSHTGTQSRSPAGLSRRSR